MFINFKRKLIFAVLYVTAIWNFSIDAVSLTTGTTYPAFCQQAVMDAEVFAHFKRNPYYQQILEHLSYETGCAYLEFIIQTYPDLVSFFDKFRENDTLGDPITSDYGRYGWFSPTTLRYIKVAGDLKQQFGDLSKMHIVEIGGGYGGQCKILAELTGFASYTIIDLPEGIALTKKYLSLLGIQNVNFIENNLLEQVGSYDLVISNYAFSEIDQSEQQKYLKHVINPTKNGYMTMNFISQHLKSLSIDDLIRVLHSSNKKGKVKKEYPNTHPDNLILIWKTIDALTFVQKKDSPTTIPIEHSNAITYSFSGGRLGDNLVAYFHAKWLAYKYTLPFRYIPFPYADNFMLSDEDRPFNPSEFQNTITTTNETDLKAVSNSSIFVIPYLPVNKEYLYNPEKRELSTWAPAFQVEWENPEFRSLIRRCLTPKTPLLVANLPSDKITVGVHIRRGAGDASHFIGMPLKFPNDNYYLQQITRLSRIFKDQPLYVYILTDDLNPSSIVEYYQDNLKNPNIYFDYCKERNNPSINVLEDFFLITKFDCLIIPNSNFSLMASKIADSAIVITPVHPTLVQGHFVIDEVELAFNGQLKHLEKN